MTSRHPVTWLDRVLETSSDLRGRSPERYREQRLDWLLRTLESHKYRDPRPRAAPRCSQVPRSSGAPYWDPSFSYADMELAELARILHFLEPQHRRSIGFKLPRLLGDPLYLQFLAFHLTYEENWKAPTAGFPPPGLSRVSEAQTEANSSSGGKAEILPSEAEAEVNTSSRSEEGTLPLLEPRRTLNIAPLCLLNITNEQSQPENPDGSPSPAELCYMPPPEEEDKDLMMASRIG